MRENILLRLRKYKTLWLSSVFSLSIITLYWYFPLSGNTKTEDPNFLALRLPLPAALSAPVAPQKSSANRQNDIKNKMAEKLAGHSVEKDAATAQLGKIAPPPPSAAAAALKFDARVLAASFERCLATPELDLTAFLAAYHQLCLFMVQVIGKAVAVAVHELEKHVKLIEKLRRWEEDGLRD